MTLEGYDLKESKSLNRFCIERDLADTSRRKYRVCLQRYVDFTQMTLEDLIKEADQEEDTIIRINKRKIRNRLIEFRVYLKEHYSANTLMTTMVSVNTFYKHFGISIPDLPPITYRKSPNDEIEYEDLPTIEHVKQAIENVNTAKHKALFLFMACSGTARKETVNFTFGQFLEGIQEYRPHVKTVEEIINELDGKCEDTEKIMPLFKMRREKTGYNYYTIVTPECTQFMITYLKSSRANFKPEDSFFQLNENGITSAFRSINRKMNWGKRGTIDFFSPHRLRKFNASAIEDTDLANYIQGRKPNKIKETYFKKNKLKVREEYLNHLNKFGIFSTYDILINSKAYQSLLAEKNRLSEELKQAKNDYEELMKEVNDMRVKIDNVTLINDIAKIQDYIIDDEIVNKYNLSSKIIELYKSDVKKDNFEGVTSSYIDDLIMIARNNVVTLGLRNEPEIYNDELWNQINEEINHYYSEIMTDLSLELSDGLRKKINYELNNYAEKVYETKGKVETTEVNDIVIKIALGGA